jgi:hypothetical protein
MDATMEAKKPFSLGQLVATPGAMRALLDAGQSPSEFLDRHGRGDWGDVSGGDGRLNDEAVEEGSRMFSAYMTNGGVRIWVITEADRSSTCILLPDEY